MDPSRASHRPVALVPGLVLALCVVMAASTSLLAAITVDLRADGITGLPAVAVMGVMLLSFPLVGALVASRLPGSPLGWLLLGLGVMFSVGPFLERYASATVDGQLLPGRVHAAWGSSVLLQNPAAFAVIALLLLLFPSGRPLTAAWGRVTRLLPWAIGMYSLVLAVKPGTLAESVPLTDNPFGLAWVAPVWAVVDLVFGVGFMCAVLAGIVCSVLRFRRSTGIERQQLKWLASGSTGLALVILSGPVVFWPNPALESWWTSAFVVGLTLLPATAGVAILRYRLFEIERIVSRTVSYSLVAAVVSGAYVVMTLMLRSVAGPIVGEGDLVIAMSTLAAAAVFRPVQRRVGAAVDRRFNRARYDADRAVASFAARIRDETDPDQGTASVAGVVRDTLAPSHVRVWLVG